MIKLFLIVKDADGGTGTFLTNFLKIKNFFKDKIDIKTLVFEKPSYRKLEEATFLHDKLFYPANHFLFNSVKNLLSDAISLVKIINFEKPDIILAINSYPNIIISLCTFVVKPKPIIILTHHNNLSAVINKIDSIIFKLLIKLCLPLLYKQANIHISVSNGVSKDICLLTSQRYTKVIYYGLNTLSSNKVKILKKRIKIVSIGRFDEQKDFTNIIEAFELINKRNKNLTLTVIGGGKNYNEIIKYTNSSRSYYCIKVIKWKKDVIKEIYKYDLFLFSSFYEGLPNVIIEAMSQGLPIISTDTPYGPREILDNGKYGILVPMKDPKAMAEAIQKLLTDKKLYIHYSKMSLERVKFFSEEKMLRAYKRLILNVIKSY